MSADMAKGGGSVPLAERNWVRGVIITGIALCSALSAALLLQLGRIGAISGGRPARRLYPGDEPVWLHVLVNHVTVNGISRSGDTLAPLLLLALAIWLSVRLRRWAPLASVLAALALVAAVLFTGKGFLGRMLGESALTWSPSAVSGPATAVVVAGGMAAWLLRGYFGRALWGLAAAVALVIGATQLYLGHRIDAVFLSWLTGLVILGVVLGGCRRRRARA